ncbi:MAG: tRNA preQ1(34) S-adenosylmethionine ribosyltransferase-isomerase QueA [bacterium]
MTRLKTSDFNYDLPRSHIAQEPALEREESRLLVYRRATGSVEHTVFGKLGDYLVDRALLVLNDTKVIPARLYGRKERTGGGIELLLVKEIGRNEWECLLKPSGRVREGEVIVFEGSAMTARASGRRMAGIWSVGFDGVASVMEEIERIGRMPLPPYIKRSRDVAHEARSADKERYQTVYARQPGAVAAPTAGLHFSEVLLRSLEQRGVAIAMITLHVGLGTFRPVEEEYVSDHRLHGEYYEIGPRAAEAINRAASEGRQIVVVGTTAARALESAADEHGEVRVRSGCTELFIHPPYEFKIVSNMLTNFHLPNSTLLMLIAALVGREKILELYETAKREGYRFYSYGDAMLILNSKHQAPNLK